MIRGRLVHLLIVVALLCSQMVSAAHIASHVHGPVHSENHAHDFADHHLPVDKFGQSISETQHESTPSCVMYHVHAGACFLPQNVVGGSGAGFVTSHELPSLTPEWVTLVRGLHSIRGPPHFS